MKRNHQRRRVQSLGSTPQATLNCELQPVCLGTIGTCSRTGSSRRCFGSRYNPLWSRDSWGQQTHEVLRKGKLYQHLGIDSIEHLECLSHVAKRMKTNLCKRQNKLMKNIRSRKAGARELYTSELHMAKGKLAR